MVAGRYECHGHEGGSDHTYDNQLCEEQQSRGGRERARRGGRGVAGSDTPSPGSARQGALLTHSPSRQLAVLPLANLQGTLCEKSETRNVVFQPGARAPTEHVLVGLLLAIRAGHHVEPLQRVGLCGLGDGWQRRRIGTSKVRELSAEALLGSRCEPLAAVARDPVRPDFPQPERVRCAAVAAGAGRSISFDAFRGERRKGQRRIRVPDLLVRVPQDCVSVDAMCARRVRIMLATLVN